MPAEQLLLQEKLFCVDVDVEPVLVGEHLDERVVREGDPLGLVIERRLELVAQRLTV